MLLRGRYLGPEVFVQVDDRVAKDESEYKRLQKVFFDKLMIGRGYMGRATLG